MQSLKFSITYAWDVSKLCLTYLNVRLIWLNVNFQLVHFELSSPVEGKFILFALPCVRHLLLLSQSSGLYCSVLFKPSQKFKDKEKYGTRVIVSRCPGMIGLIWAENPVFWLIMLKAAGSYWVSPHWEKKGLIWVLKSTSLSQYVYIYCYLATYCLYFLHCQTHDCC